MLEFLDKSLAVAYTGFTASVASAQYCVVELQAPATRDLFVTSVIIHTGVSAYLEKGSATFATFATPTVVPPDPRSNFSTECGALASGCYGASSTDPNSNGLLIPSSNGTIPGTYSVEVFPVPLIVEAGEFLALISESKAATVRYGFRWLEKEA